MTDSRMVPFNSVLAWLGWSAAGVMEVLWSFEGWRGTGVGAVLFAAAAATLNVRNRIDQLEQRERNAFDLGRESVRNLR